MNNKYKLIHNGMDIQFFDTPNEVMDYITSILDNYRHLSPQLKLNYKLTNDIQFMMYEYSTLYTEMFIIERR